MKWKSSEYPEPWVYLIKKSFPECCISLADITTNEEFSKGNKHLVIPGTKEEINNFIHFFQIKKFKNKLPLH